MFQRRYSITKGVPIEVVNKNATISMSQRRYPITKGEPTSGHNTKKARRKNKQTSISMNQTVFNNKGST